MCWPGSRSRASAIPDALPWLLLSSCCLYAGGRGPERRVRSGPRSDRAAGAADPVGTRQHATGGRASAACCWRPAWQRRAAASRRRRRHRAGDRRCWSLLYDAWGKRQAPIAPLNMALCRALNLMLGVAAVPAALCGGVADRRGAAALHLRGHRAQPRRGPRRLGAAPRRLL